MVDADFIKVSLLARGCTRSKDVDSAGIRSAKELSMFLSLNFVRCVAYIPQWGHIAVFSILVQDSCTTCMQGSKETPPITFSLQIGQTPRVAISVVYPISFL